MAAHHEIRPLTQDDVPAADEVAWAALRVHVPEEFVATIEGRRATRGQARISRIVETDPGGSLCSTDAEGRISGVALAIVREDVWGLSLLAVRPDVQGQGIGARLLERALDHGGGGAGGVILSSEDARAMRRYSRAGFDLLPSIAATGPVNHARLPGGLRSRPGDPQADRATIDRAGRFVRGASYVDDVAWLTSRPELGHRLLVFEDRGFAVHTEDAVPILAAVDEEAATDLLLSCLAAGAPGTTVAVDFLTAGQDWAVHACLDVGLSLCPDGPVFVRGALGTLSPWLPSGQWL